MKKVLLLMFLFMYSCSIYRTETYQEKAIRQAMKGIFERPQDFVNILNRSAFVKEGTKNFEKMPSFFRRLRVSDENFEGKEITFNELIKKSKKIVAVPDDKSLIEGGGYLWEFEYYIYSDEFSKGFEVLTITWVLNSYNCWSFGGIFIR